MSPLRFLEACHQRRTDATPVWFMRQAGRYMEEYRRLRARHSLLELCERPDLATEVTLQPVRRFPVDAAILFTDLLLPVRAMGVRLEFRRGEGPVLSPAVRGNRDVARLREFDPEEDLGFILETVRNVRRELPSIRRSGGAVSLIGFAGAPFTLAAYLVEGGPSSHYLHVKTLMHSDAKTWCVLMEKLSRVAIRCLQSQVEAGVQAVQLFDSWVGALSREDYVRFVLPYSTRVLKAMKELGVPTIHFGTGTAGFLEDFVSAGGDVIGVDWRIPLGAAWSRIGSRAIQGNLDPALLAAGSRAELKRDVRRILSEAKGRPGHIFNVGHGILPSTPADNVCAVTEWVHELSAK